MSDGDEGYHFDIGANVIEIANVDSENESRRPMIKLNRSNVEKVVRGITVVIYDSANDQIIDQVGFDCENAWNVVR